MLRILPICLAALFASGVYSVAQAKTHSKHSHAKSILLKTQYVNSETDYLRIGRDGRWRKPENYQLTCVSAYGRFDYFAYQAYNSSS